MIPKIDDQIANISDKISNLDCVSGLKSLCLPKKNYGPFCLKILDDFIDHHKLSKNLPLPFPGLSVEESLSRIFDVILHSMGNDYREKMLKELDEYMNKRNVS